MARFRMDDDGITGAVPSVEPVQDVVAPGGLQTDPCASPVYAPENTTMQPPDGEASPPPLPSGASPSPLKHVRKHDIMPEIVSIYAWIFENVGLGDSVQRADAPSGGTYDYLQFIRSSKIALAEFYNKAVPKLMAAEMDRQDAMQRFQADSEHVIKSVDRVLAALGGSDPPKPWELALAAPGDVLAAPGDVLAAPGDVLAAPGDVLAAPGDVLAAPGGYGEGPDGAF